MKAVEHSISPTDDIIEETDSMSRNSASIAENNLSSQLTELTVADSEVNTKAENGSEATTMISEIKANESSNFDPAVSETKAELHIPASGKIIIAFFYFSPILSLLRRMTQGGRKQSNIRGARWVKNH